jgi:hypothetical protein
MQTTTATGRKLREKLVDAPDSVGARRRERRWGLFAGWFPDLRDMKVLDLGGRLETWRRAPERPGYVHVVNCARPDGDVPDWARYDRGDACDLPGAFRGQRYDLVYSNSVVEHVGGYARRVAFADAVRDAADRHWVQTPYRYFPVEPHLLFPGFQFLPLNARAAVAQRWPLIHSRPPDRRRALRNALEIELLGRTELAYLFPESDIVVERMAGFPKSLVAVRRS